MNRTRGFTILRRIVGATFAGCISLATLTGTSSSPASAAAPLPAVVLKGEGAWSTFEMNRDWHNQLATANHAIDFRFTAVGSHFGRVDYLNKGADWVLSGVPFTDDELSQAKLQRSDLIDAPLVVASLGMLFQRPSGGPQQGFQTIAFLCDPFDPSTWPSTITSQAQAQQECTPWVPYPGDIKVPWANLAAMLLDYSKDADGTSAGESMSSWNEAGVLAAFGVDNLSSIPPGIGPATVLRSDPDETMMFVQQFASRFAPKVWAGLKADNPNGSWEPITESLGRSPFISRGQADQQADQLKWRPSNPRTGAEPTGGVLAPVPASMIVEPRTTWAALGAPANYVELLPVRNGNGDWVKPTSATLTAAAAAGLDTPLYAFDHNVPNAYPFTWIDHLYAPAHGLSIDKTEALATMIRYIATKGQDVAAVAGEGRLPAPLVQKSLAAADALVRSNCVGSDRIIVTSTDPGAFAPTTPPLPSIGSMLHCEAAPVSTTTTVTPTTLSFSSGPGDAASGGAPENVSTGASTESNASASDSANAADVPASSGTDETKTVVVAKKRALLVASGLPEQPNGPSSFDRLGAFLLGVVLFLLLRRPVERLWRRVFA